MGMPKSVCNWRLDTYQGALAIDINLRALFESRNLKRISRLLNIKTLITLNDLITLISYVRLVDGNLSLYKFRPQWQRKLYSSETDSNLLQIRQTMM